MAHISKKQGLILLLGLTSLVLFFLSQTLKEDYSEITLNSTIPISNFSENIQLDIRKKMLGSKAGQFKPSNIKRENFKYNLTNHKQFLIDTSGCRINNVSAFEKETFHLIKKEKPFKCKNQNNVTFGLVYLDNKILHINSTVLKNAVKHYNASKRDFYCCLDYFKRYFDEENDSGYRLLGKCNKFSDKLEITDEYMHISCYLPKEKSANEPIYQNFDFAILRKSHVEARCRVQEQANEASGINCPDRLSVLIMGIDSVSRLQSQRHLNRTRNTLKDMGAIEFVGYNRVGENTYPNMGAALMTGETRDYLDRECIDKKKFMDNCSFLWDYFQVAGYRTAFVENMNNFGLYTYSKKGFHRQPADYYGRTYFNGVGKVHSGIPDCYRGGRSISDDEAVVQWAVEFQKEFMNDPHFGYFWISKFSHNYMNTLQHVDKFLPLQLQRLAKNGGQLLNKTLLVLMSDHGLRFGKLSKTEVGRYEINLPFLFLVFPQWFKDKYPEAIKQVTVNARERLTTLYDLHATLRDIASCSRPFKGTNFGKDASIEALRGISLFRSIPENRTCLDSGIPEKYCSCYKQSVTLSTKDKKAHLLGVLVVGYLNNLTADLRHLCARLNMFSVDHVKYYVNANVSEKNNYEKYVVVLTTNPGNGTFEALIKYNVNNKAYKVNKEVTRLNKYGNSSICIQNTSNAKLFPICLCSQETS